MKLSVDHSFHIGEQHLRTGKPCQDYALSGTLPNNLSYAIVSDGCSSGGMTDIGARLMSLALKEAVSEGGLKDTTERTKAYLASMGRSLGLDTRDLLATSLIAVGNEAKLAGALVVGDGVMVEQNTTSMLIATKYEWSDNRPFYLAYTGELRAQFAANQPTLTRERWHIQSPEEYELLSTEELSPQLGQRGYWWYHEPPHGPWDLTNLAVMSDGVLQVENLPWQRVVFALMHFKSTSGQFVTRRMNRFLQEAKQQGRGPIDDIAMAVINFNPEK